MATRELIPGARRLGLMWDQRTVKEKLWQEFFADPSKWFDHRSEKVNARFPDFKHKKTEEGLWLDSKSNPPWVRTELAAMAPGTLEHATNVSWNTRLTGYVRAGQCEKTMELFRQMKQEGVVPDRFTFVAVINACANLRALEDGRRIHAEITGSRCKFDAFISNSLVDMYAKCGSIEAAWEVFISMPTHTVVSWNAIILGYVKCGHGQKAFELFQQMQQEGVKPTVITFLGLLNACARLETLAEGRQVHKMIIQTGCEDNTFVGSSLIDMYAKCGSIEDARRVFDKMQTRTLVSWNAMIQGYVRCEQGEKALALYQQLEWEGLKPAPLTFVGVINACASVGLLDKGRRVHEQIILSGCESNVFVGSSLVDMYCKCGSIEDACRVFNKIRSPNVVCWNAVILGHLKCGHGQKALELFQRMQLEGVRPVSVTFVGVLNACATVGALEEGRRVHEQVNDCGYETDVFVGSSLVDMYAKCGSMDDAWRVFNKMPTHDVFSWNAMILAHVKYGQGKKALELSSEMQNEGVKPDTVTFVGMLNACAILSALEEGRRVHEQIIESGCQCDVFVASSLVDMYSKCGSIGEALRVFIKMPKLNTASWNAMLGGYARHGYAKEALELFKQMCQDSVEMGAATFVSLLSVCSHSGLVDEGLDYFESMRSLYGISATLEHYACMVDLLGRAGRLHEAEDLIWVASCKLDAAVWMTLLGACRLHGNLEMAKCIAKRVHELDPKNPSGYVLLSNIYSAAGKWDNSADLKLQTMEVGVEKSQGAPDVE